MTTPDTFSLTGPLPGRGLTLLEASAGTGKTYAIAALTVRYVAAGTPISSMMIVTFGRAAAQELRSRVHARLGTSAQAVRNYLACHELPDDAVDAQLCQQGDPALVLERLESALGDIDLAAITTIHEYSSRMLDELGLLVDHDETSQFQEELRPLFDEAAADLYVAQPEHRATWKDLRAAAVLACENPTFDIIPDDVPLAKFAHQARERVEQRKRLLHVHSYEDMVTRLAQALADPVTGPTAAAHLARRFPIVLVDEFQDTDPEQWSILRTAFAQRSTVVLIGDPKQAIYGFRGGDVHTYLSAKDDVVNVQTMGTNYRSDEGIVEAVNELFGAANLGTSDAPIFVPKVHAAPHPPRIIRDGQPISQPFLIRQLAGEPSADRNLVRDMIDADLIEQIQVLLTGKFRVVGAAGSKALGPEHMAVLVRTNDRGRQLHERLVAAGIPATFSGTESVYSSSSASDWLALLQALTTLRSNEMGRAALTSLVGCTSEQLAQADGQIRTQTWTLLRELASLLATSGVMAVFERLVASTQLYSRLLSEDDGERRLTDLRHLAENLNDAQRRQRLSGAELAVWLQDRVERASSSQPGERSRKLETDRRTVTISTIHQMKGLEFPVVFLPEVADQPLPQSQRSSKEAAPSTKGHWQGRRVIDLAPDAERQAAFEADDAAEHLRLLYVASTRASSLVTAWWAPFKKRTPASPLHRLLCSDGGVPALTYDVADPRRKQYFNHVRVISVPMTSPEFEDRIDTAPDHPQWGLSARSFDRTIDHSWVRTSYSGLTQGLHTASSVLVEAEPQLLDADAISTDEPIEPDSDGLDLAPAIDAAGPVSALAALPGGTTFGTLVHAILEEADLGADDPAPEFLTVSTRALARRPLADVTAGPLAEGLTQVALTPLGDLTDGASLHDRGVANRLAELDFELPMGNADGHATLGALADLLDDPSLADPSGVLDGYGHQLAMTGAGANHLRGFLTGSIDVVLRVGSAGSERFVVLDYKTNRIPVAPDVTLRPEHYSAATMARVMSEAHYPLQSLLYQVALHRYLSWRLPGYDPAKHLGGSGYLFVRGMAGPKTPMTDGMPCGVFVWRPPVDLVLAASDVLAGVKEGAR